MHMDLWRTHTFIAALAILGLAGCQSVAHWDGSVGIAEQSVAAKSSADSQEAAQKTQSQPQSESSRIRANWQKLNFATVAPTLAESEVAQSDRDRGLVRMTTDVRSAKDVQLATESRDRIPDSGEVVTAEFNADSETSPLAVRSALSEVTAALLAPAPASAEVSESFPVDLPTILRLAGGRNWAVQLAWERINQAEANVTAAESLWLPSLNVGIGATKHEGQIQATSGEVVDVSRNALFVGGGAKTGNAPLAGGAGGPARFAVDLSLADALFQPLVARQMSCAARSRHAVEFNDAQLTAAHAYFDLVAAQGEVAVVGKNLTDAGNLLAMTEAFVAAGKASQAEVTRVQVIVARQRQALVDAELKLALASSELIRIVRLDPAQMSSETLLFSADDHLLAIELISETSDLDDLIRQGQRSRPEVAEQYALAQARLADARAQELRPFIPNVNLGLSAGGFGGGIGSNIDGFDGRADFDALLVWEIRNLGFGEQAARRDRSSQYRQSVFRSQQMQELIAAEVRNAWHRVAAGRKRMNIAQDNVSQAGSVLTMNLDRIRGLEGLPLEAVQAVTAVSESRLAYLQAVVDYNKAQAELLRAVGRPVDRGLQVPQDSHEDTH